GSDLPFLPKTAAIVAVDITPAMVERIKSRAEALQLQINAQVMDGQNLKFEDNRFDAIILNLILAVIPDPLACLQEAERVLKPGGKIVVFDKFLPDTAKVSLFRKLLNLITNTFFSDITRKLGDIVAETSLIKVYEKPAALKGVFKLVLLKKP
ncbi:MAG: class I SAM-dependent methyltransferase, partial [Hymenobacteraceae bacterium]|nr:class I SAM-dependent methyltransferase [Hymenobacteraceae bacterium]MDX5396290.1 class I SAM-dependent methyltransferase [Hymenobacteraceae bacterium]MDX5512351.1 class I SAM-dependent methyltransferase [Hymenobacteraceae bacterium]